MEPVKPRLLVVDDEPGIRLAYSQWFTKRGFEVEAVANGLHAVEQCREQPYDAIIMDLEMPVMGGAAAAREIRAMHPAVPIIIVSAYLHDHAELDAANAMFTKPVRLLDLEAHLRGMLPPNS